MTSAFNDSISQRSPIEVSLADGAWFVLEANADHVMLTFGLKASELNAETLLRRRAAQQELYGDWCPAQLQDNTLVLTRRLPRWANGSVDFLSDESFTIAKGLLS